MKPLPILAAAVALSAATAYLTTRIAPAEARADTGELAALSARLDEVERSAAAAAESMAAASAQPASADVVQPLVARVSASEIEDAVARWMAENTLAAVPVPTSASEASPSARTADLLARLETGDLGEEALNDIWYELREAGLTDEALAALEARAERYPDDAQAHLDLGIGYIHQLDESGGGPERGRLATLADQSFDRALEIDDHNWTARFYKAVSLSHWPPFLGKQPEAIAEFEVLRAQQEVGAKSSSHAQTYLYLGNLYREAGDLAKAKATWQAGLDLFPGDAALTGQLAAYP